MKWHVCVLPSDRQCNVDVDAEVESTMPLVHIHKISFVFFQFILFLSEINVFDLWLSLFFCISALGIRSLTPACSSSPRTCRVKRKKRRKSVLHRSNHNNNTRNFYTRMGQPMCVCAIACVRQRIVTTKERKERKKNSSGGEKEERMAEY